MAETPAFPIAVAKRFGVMVRPHVWMYQQAMYVDIEAMLKDAGVPYTEEAALRAFDVLKEKIGQRCPSVPVRINGEPPDHAN